MLSLLLPLLIAADPSSEATKAQAVFTAHCIKCHGGAKPRAGLELSSPEKTLAGAKSGPVLTAQKPDESLLVQVLAAGHETHMPPDKQLDKNEIDAIVEWIKGLQPTAVVPRKEMQVSDADRAFWAFRPVQPIAPPIVKHTPEIRNPIDNFILSGLEAKNLQLAPEANRRVLIRRLTFDLIGLPPTPEEIDAFLSDKSADAYEKVVDRLLASPHYGERWARHWLDLARYADAEAPDRLQPNAPQSTAANYHYRDYVIRSLNADKPYDRFLMEQLAGDELAPGDRDAAIATGFLALGPPSTAGGEKARFDDLDDALSATSSVFLGLTVGCARCHDHKTDPIPQRDYYRLLAVFAGLERRTMSMASPTEQSTIDAASLAQANEQADLRKRLESLQKIVPDQPDEDEIPPKDFIGPPGPSRWWKARLREIENMQEKLNSMGSEEQRHPTALVTGDVAKIPSMYLLLRGDPKARADEVQPGTPTVLASNSVLDTSGASRRLELARWLARQEHPLTARVAVNRLWHYHLGRGLVGTPSNFGPGGEKPTHPELLDWLATRFVADGWSLKKMHRLIVTSATYRQSSAISADVTARDPENQLWSRYPRRRLEAEAIRDAMLFTSGRLNPVMFGPGARSRPGDGALAPEAARSALAVREGPQQSRRSIYLHVSRETPSVLLESFDTPPPACPCEKRVQTTVATQALLLLNGPMVLELAGHLATRAKTEAGDDTKAQVDRLYRMTLGRPPRDSELEKALKFLADPAIRARTTPRRNANDSGALSELAHVLFNTNEFIYLD